MFKVVFILALLYCNTIATSIEPESETLQEWEYWNAFSKTFSETANYWEAESAALEAEKLAEDRTGIAEFLKETTEKDSGHNRKQNIKTF